MFLFLQTMNEEKTALSMIIYDTDILLQFIKSWCYYKTCKSFKDGHGHLIIYHTKNIITYRFSTMPIDLIIHNLGLSFIIVMQFDFIKLTMKLMKIHVLQLIYV